MKSFFIVICMFLFVGFAAAQMPKWKADPKVLELTKQGKQYEQNNDNVNAAKAYLAAFGLDTTNYMAANDMANALGNLKDYRTELRWANKCIALNPKLAGGYISLGNAYYGQLNFDKAIESYKQAEKLDPKDPNAPYCLGLIEQQRGNIKQAVNYYEQSQKVDSDFYKAFYNMAVCYDKLKDYNKAYKYIDHYRIIDDNDLVMTLWRSIMHEIAAQPFNYPVIAQSGKNLEDFVPAGWKIKGKAAGDLNGDHVADVALVLECKTITAEKRAENDTIYSYPRILLVLFKNGDQYNTSVQQNTFMLRAEEGDHMSGDPYDAIEISKGILNINYEYTRSHLYYKFRYQNHDLYLIGATNAGVSHNILFSWDFNFSTRSMIHDEGESTDEDDKTAKNKEEIKHLTFPKLKKLSELKQPYTWEVAKDVFI